jgi:predicted nucleic acid-binding protein
VILVDTSVWIRFLSNQSPYAGQLDALLQSGHIIAHDYVFGELLIGDRGKRSQLLDAYQTLRHASVATHTEIVAFVRARELNGLGIGWVDVHLLASAFLGRFQIWSADANLRAAAKRLGIDYAN